MNTSSGPSRVSFRWPVTAETISALPGWTRAARLKGVFEALNSSWSEWRGLPGTASHTTVFASVEGLRSLRLGLRDTPCAVTLESEYEGGTDSHVAMLRVRLGPLLDLVLGDCADFPGSADEKRFSAWVMQAQSAQGLDGTPLLISLAYARDSASSAEAVTDALAVHALVDLHHLSPLYPEEGGGGALWRAARFLLPAVPDMLSALDGQSVEPELLGHLSDALRWYATPPAATPSSPPTRYSGETPAVASHRICGKQLVMQVLMNAESSNSVHGYMDRMKASIGAIFLGMDASEPEYAAQATQVNAAIHAITEEDAFTSALEQTRAVLQGQSGRDMKSVSDAVLARLCTLWFDVPDDYWVKSGGSYIPIPPPQCPGSYGPPSGYIFQPEPGNGLALFGKIHGRALRYGVGGMVREMRRKGVAPKGALSSAIFAAFPDDDDLVARTLVGVMMGFLPTAQGNLVAVMDLWKGERFNELRQALLAHPERDIYESANEVLRGPLIQAMQESPMPPAVWRTAVRDHVLGGMQIRTGDRLAVDIESATHEDLKNGVIDAYPIFGGNREANPHPTHACPGFWMGMGVMLGIFTALMEAGN